MGLGGRSCTGQAPETQVGARSADLLGWLEACHLLWVGPSRARPTCALLNVLNGSQQAAPAPNSLRSSTQLLCNRPPLCMQVMHRCPCLKKDICGPLEERVKQLAAEGKLPPYPVEGRTFEPEKMGIESW